MTGQTIQFPENSFIVPIVNTYTDHDLQIFFAEKNKMFDYKWLFNGAFLTKHSVLQVIPLPYFDPKDYNALNNLIDEYTENMTSWLAKSYRIDLNYDSTNY